MISKREAWKLGRKPPTKPITIAKSNPLTIIDADSEKENANSENDPKLSVEIDTNCRNDAKKSPSNPPTTDNNKDSRRNAL